MSERQVVFILGLGHSGGTLLGNVLDVHPRVLHVGEILAPLSAGHPFRCYYCGEKPCPIWGDVLPEEFVRRCYTDFLRQRQRRWRIVMPVMEAIGLFYGPGTLYERVFSRLPETGVIIDKSMDTDWAKWNSQSSRFESRYLLLVRDMRGVVASWFRKYPKRSASEWVRIHRKTLESVIEFYDRLDASRKMIVRYEDLVIEPEKTLAGLCQFLNISYTPDFLEYSRFEHHIIGGNRKVAFQNLSSRGAETGHLFVDIEKSDVHDYYRVLPGFRPDLRWKQELEEDELCAIEEEVRELQQRFGYF